MLSENQRIRGLISSVIDIVLLIAAYLLANFLRFNWLPFFEEGGAGPALDIARSPMVALGWAGYAVVMVLLYWSRGLYNPSRLRGLWQRSTTIAFGNALGVVGFMALLFVFRLQNFSRGVMLLLYGFSTGFLIFKRMFGVFDAGVNALHREAIGPVALDAALVPGQWRELTAEEVNALRAAAKPKN